MATIWRKIDKVLRISLEVLAPFFINVLFTVLSCTHMWLDRRTILEEGPRVTISLPLEMLEWLLWTVTPKPDVQMARSFKKKKEKHSRYFLLHNLWMDFQSCYCGYRECQLSTFVLSGPDHEHWFIKTKQDLYNVLYTQAFSGSSATIHLWLVACIRTKFRYRGRLSDM